MSGNQERSSQPKLIEVSDTDRPIAHPVYQVPADAGRQTCPPLDLSAKDHSAHLITQTFDFFRISGAPEAPGEIEEFLLSALLSLHVILDELQHTVGA